jgi:hypothetical protein
VGRYSALYQVSDQQTGKKAANADEYNIFIHYISPWLSKI